MNRSSAYSKFALLGLAFLTLLLQGCGGGGGAGYTPPNSGSVDPEAINPADNLIIRLDGVPPEDKQVLNVQVAQDGTINMPYMNRIKVTDMNTQQLSRYLEEQYVQRKIFTTPVVTVSHGGRWVYVYGEVRGPGRATYHPGMTMVELITANGGFTEYANKRKIQVTRDGKVFYFNADRALQNPKYDIPVQPGDRLKVDRTIF